MRVVWPGLVPTAFFLVSVFTTGDAFSTTAVEEVGFYLKQLVDFRKSEVSPLADAKRFLSRCADSLSEIKCSPDDPVMRACILESKRLTGQRVTLLERYGAELAGTEPGRLLKELTVPTCPEVPTSSAVGTSARTRDLFSGVAHRNERYDPSGGGDFREQIDADNISSTISFFAFNSAPFVTASRERREREEEARVQQEEAARVAQDRVARNIIASESDVIGRIHAEGASSDLNLNRSKALGEENSSLDHRCRGMYSCYDIFPNCFGVVSIKRPPKSATSYFEDRHKVCNRCAVNMALGWSVGVRPGGVPSLYTLKPGECRGAGDSEQMYPRGANIFLVSSCRSEDYFSSEIKKCVHLNK